jgi:acetyl esterase/lipase
MKKTILLALGLAAHAALAAPSAPLPLWPGTPPDEKKTFPPEADLNKPTDRLIAGRPIIRLGNVSIPTITIYRPDPAKDTGATVVVCPGGGYSILAMDLEGTEICDWLNSIGVTGVLLKYRVPAREGGPRYAAPLQDAQRAMGLVRHQAATLGLDPKRIGILGFSAGAHLSATLGVNHATRTYAAIDEADAVSCRPDFTVLIYPGGLVDAKQNNALRPEVVPVREVTPPTFIAMTEVDRVENAVEYYKGLKAAGIAAEMHLYPTGEHGYGLRRTADDVTTWPERVADWLKTGGWLARAKPGAGK